MNRELLFQAEDAHYEKTGHDRFVMGANFIECDICGKHAHLSTDGEALIVHDRSYQVQERIGPEEF